MTVSLISAFFSLMETYGLELQNGAKSLKNIEHSLNYITHICSLEKQLIAQVIRAQYIEMKFDR